MTRAAPSGSLSLGQMRSNDLNRAATARDQQIWTSSEIWQRPEQRSRNGASYLMS